MTTGVVSIKSDLERKKWMKEGLVQKASKSFWAPYSGKKDAIVLQKTTSTAGAGHTVVFDLDGNLSGAAVKGKETAYGTGESKKKFSDRITVERYRLVCHNGDKFDGVNIGDLGITQHSDSRSKLGDLWIRWKDQGLFDAAQGCLKTNNDGVQTPSHSIDLGSQALSYDALQYISTSLKNSIGLTGGVRRPLDPFKTENGRPCWLFVVDSLMAHQIRIDPKYQSLVAQSDIRGRNNAVISGVVGKLGDLLIVEASTFFGHTQGTGVGWGLNSSRIDISGLRQYNGENANSAIWTGQEGFNPLSGDLHSRGLLMGEGALQLAMGKSPDYKWQESEDFAIDSESALEVWCEMRKTNLKAENDDYDAAKVADLDYGVIAVDVKTALGLPSAA